MSATSSPLAPIITLDGPTASGKGTVALRVAQALGWHVLDSGALYRLTALAAMRAQVPLDDGAALGRLARELDVSFGAQGACLNGEPFVRNSWERTHRAWLRCPKCVLACSRASTRFARPLGWWPMAEIWVQSFSPTRL